MATDAEKGLSKEDFADMANRVATVKAIGSMCDNVTLLLAMDSARLQSACRELESLLAVAVAEREKYETELQRTADMLQKRTWIDEVKALGLPEVAAMVEDVLNERDEQARLLAAALKLGEGG